MYDNICERFSKLEITGQTDVSKLTDQEIISKKSHFTKNEYDYNEILDRVVKLSEMNPGEFDETNEFLPAINVRKQKLKVLLSSYNFKLESEI